MQAMAVGRLLRQFGLTAGVASTIPADCASLDEKACLALKRSGQPLNAKLHVVGATCNSACVFALAGAKDRLVPPTARLGVHWGLPVRPVSADQAARAAAAHAQALRTYGREMGIDADLVDTAVKVPHDQIQYLSRDQIAAFGIDQRKFHETPWTESETPPNRFFLAKFFTQAKGELGTQFRTSALHLSCAGRRQIAIAYSRGLASDPIDRNPAINFKIGQSQIAFTRNASFSTVDGYDPGGLFEIRYAFAPFEFFESASVTSGLEIIEIYAKPAAPRTIGLSTHGLIEGITALRQRCNDPS